MFELPHEKSPENLSEKSPEINFEQNESEIESTLLKLEECEDEAEGLQTIAADIVKSKGHFSPNLCYNDSEQGHIEINHLQQKSLKHFKL